MTTAKIDDSQSARWLVRCAFALAAFVGAALLLRVYLISRATYDPDEFFTLGSAWRIAQGKLPYLDFIDGHPPVLHLFCGPLLHKIYSLPLAWLGERADFIDWFRWLHAGEAVLLYWAMFALFRRLFDTGTALWALALQNAFFFFLRTTTHVRPDLPGLLLIAAAAVILVGKTGASPSWQRLLAAAAVAGFATAVDSAMVFLIFGAGAWLFFIKRAEGSARAGLLAGIAFVAAGLAAYFAGFVPVFGGRTPEGWIAGAKMFAFYKIYLGGLENGSWQAFKTIFRESPVPWALVILAVIAMHAQPKKMARDGIRPLLPLFLADAGALFIVVHDRVFAQHYLPFALFGAAVAARAIRRALKAVEQRIAPQAPGVVEIAAIVVFIGVEAAFGAHCVGKMRADEAQAARELAVAGAPRPDANGQIDPDTTLWWVTNRKEFFNSFRYRPKAERAAQIRFLLTHSRPGDVVYTDWENPPFRQLPAAVHHGLALTKYATSNSLRENPALVARLQRFDPYFSLEDPTLDRSMIRLFTGARPDLILLDGSMAQLFCESDEFRYWLTQHYRFVFQPEGGCFFARRDPDWK